MPGLSSHSTSSVIASKTASTSPRPNASYIDRTVVTLSPPTSPSPRLDRRGPVPRRHLVEVCRHLVEVEHRVTAASHRHFPLRPPREPAPAVRSGGQE